MVEQVCHQVVRSAPADNDELVVEALTQIIWNTLCLEPASAVADHATTESDRKRAADCGPSLWSCRESNPGPTAFPQGFSVRSSLCLYSDLPVTRTSRDDDPSRCGCPDESRDRTHRWIPLADARVRAEGAPGLTDQPSLRQRGRSRADWNRRLIGCNDAYGGLLPAPARFP
jgi:hypothetical protein